MRMFETLGEVAAACLPSESAAAVVEAVQAQERCPGGSAWVVLVETGDTLEAMVPLLGRPLGSLSLEMAWRRHGCLVGLVLWGNAGDGVTFVCLELPGYAEELQEWLRREL